MEALQVVLAWGGVICAGLVVLQGCTSSGFGNSRPVQASVDGLDLRPPVEKQPPPPLLGLWTSFCHRAPPPKSRHGRRDPDALHHGGLRHLRPASGGLRRYRPLLCIFWWPTADNPGGLKAQVLCSAFGFGVVD